MIATACGAALVFVAGYLLGRLDSRRNLERMQERRR